MLIPSVEIQFGGKTRHLIYDYNALAELQDEAGTYKSGVCRLKALRSAIWAGLLAETLDRRGRETAETLSLVQVGEILSDMDPEETAELVAAVTEARGLAEPPKADPPQANPPV